MTTSISSAKVYHGSAVNYIKTVLLTELPDSSTMIDYSKNLRKYLSDSKNLRIIRKNKNYLFRGTRYSSFFRDFTVADNEPALWVYMECIDNLEVDYKSSIENQHIPVAFAIKKEEKLNGLYYKNYGKQKRENDFSKKGWKHCHILQCNAPLTFDQLTIDQRMTRLMNPMNHFPFPSPRKFDMPKDYGEDVHFIQLVLKVLLKHIYNTEKKKDAFLEFLSDAGFQEYDFSAIMDAKDFDISIAIKPNKKKNTKQSKTTYPITQKVIIPSGVAFSKNFKVSKKWLGKGLLIRSVEQGFEYDHDAVLNSGKSTLETTAKKSWDTYGYYTKTNGWPTWATNEIKIK